MLAYDIPSISLESSALRLILLAEAMCLWWLIAWQG